ncbi:Frigida-like [Sesbania bispinosa]|nr:Frigida-like [Sesbania bispinosa]
MATPDTYKPIKQETDLQHLAPPIPSESQRDGGAIIAKSVNELNDLSIAIQAFKSRYDELQNHLDFIDQAIETRTEELEALRPSTAQGAINDTNGSKAYTKDSPMIAARQASVLVLEYYLMSGCIESEAQMDPSLKEEATKAAIAWRKRLIVEGGVAKAFETDARGLILFIACFGIPSVFLNEDIWNLVRLSKPTEISHALRQSQVLLRRASDIAEGMMKRGMVVEAVDLACTFGFEEKFSPQTTLTSFLHKSEEAWKKAKQEARNFPRSLKEANEKYLAALKSIVNCLEGHKVDFVGLPGCQLKIVMLEKDISDLKKKIEEKSVAKRKVDKINSSNRVKIPEAKRIRFPLKDPSVASPSVTTLQEQRIASHMDGISSYDGSLTAHMLDGRSYGYLNNYPSAASVQIGSVSGSLPESLLGGAIADPAMSSGIGNQTGSFSGYRGDMIDNAGTMLNSNSHLYRWHGIGDGAVSYDRSVGQSFVEQPSSARVNHLYGKTSTEGYTGLPDHLSTGIASRAGGSDLYSFADAVFDM